MAVDNAEGHVLNAEVAKRMLLIVEGDGSVAVDKGVYYRSVLLFSVGYQYHRHIICQGVVHLLKLSQRLDAGFAVGVHEDEADELSSHLLQLWTHSRYDVNIGDRLSQT